MSAPPQPAISVAGLTKSFADRPVLSGIDLNIAPGTVFSLLGPNGAGKTTMVRILTTLATADSGTARVGGHDVSRAPGAVRECIGVTGQYSAVDASTTGTSWWTRSPSTPPTSMTSSSP
ncbi:hypothetical protein GCM10027089_26640 [Nocardia thraciensis]